MGRLSDEQQFEKAIQTDDFIIAQAAARHIPNLDLYDALRLTLLAARTDRRSYPGYMRRWLTRWIEQDRPDPARIAAASALLAQAPGHTRGDIDPGAATALTDMIARATQIKRPDRRGIDYASGWGHH